MTPVNRSIPITGESLVAGRWVKPTGESFESFNPATGEVRATQRGCAAVEADAAMQAAAEAYRTTRDMPPADVAAFLRAIADQIEALGDLLLQTGDAETALGTTRLTGERGRTCGQIRAFADLVEQGQWLDARIDTAQPDRQPLPKPDLRRVRRPLGPVVVFGASNFPFAFGAVGGDTASALAAGNPVVVKGHPSHPATSELFARAVRAAADQCNLPPGVFSMLQGAAPELTEALVRHEATEAIAFTGSQKVGRIIFDLAAGRDRPIPVFAEMGSINPLFVLPEALAARGEAIGRTLAGSITLGTGQFCTKPGVIVTVGDDAAMRSTLADALRATSPGVLLNAGITEALRRDVATMIDHQHVACITGGRAFEDQPNRFEPTLLATSAEHFVADPALRRELFGPVAMIVACDDAEQMLTVARAIEGQLTGTIHQESGDTALAARLVAVLEDRVGRIVFNGVPTGVDVCPSMQHGGPYPATTAAATTSVGAAAIERFTRYVAYQSAPAELLPEALADANPLRIVRLVNGKPTDEPL
jgi:NADP-dependent aldehyde dehydrogenase